MSTLGPAQAGGMDAGDGTWLVPPVASLAAASERVMGRLLDALTYEGILRPQARFDGDEESFTVIADDAVGRATYTWRARRRYSFGRLRTVPGSVERRDGYERLEPSSPERFLREVGSGLGVDADRLAAFAEELSRTVLNDGLTDEAAGGPGADDVSYEALESAASAGHPYHPSYKSRVGFDLLDNLAFAPEGSPRLRPVWLAARRDALAVSALPGLDVDSFLAAELGPLAHGRIVDRLGSAGLDAAAYLPVPVHPWQWRERLLPRLVGDLRDATVVAVGVGSDDYCPQQSIRTLANVTTPAKASIKLALSIVNTSTVRTLAPHTVANAPLVTAWLRDLVARDPYLSAELRPVLLGEVLGVSYRSPGLLPAAELGAIWRESLHPHLEPAEDAAPFSALAQLDRAGRPFVSRWVEEQGVGTWARRLVEVALPPVLHLLCAHGVGVEAHAQNMTLIHRGGVPSRIALRDFHDGVRFVPDLLGDPARRPHLEGVPASHLRVNRNSYLEATDPAEVRDFTLDALCFVNLAEIAMLLEDHYGLPERHFWDLARAVVVAHRRRFPALTERFALFDVLATRVGVEQLAARRLLPDTAVRLHQVVNPLAAGQLRR